MESKQKGVTRMSGIFLSIAVNVIALMMFAAGLILKPSHALVWALFAYCCLLAAIFSWHIVQSGRRKHRPCLRKRMGLTCLN